LFALAADRHPQMAFLFCAGALAPVIYLAFKFGAGEGGPEG
jgi:hypothetical protein